jgi:hypothetical protein
MGMGVFLYVISAANIREDCISWFNIMRLVARYFLWVVKLIYLVKQYFTPLIRSVLVCLLQYLQKLSGFVFLMFFQDRGVAGVIFLKKARSDSSVKIADSLRCQIPRVIN